MIKKIKEKIVNRYPTFYNIEISSRCNLKCVMCEYRYWDKPGKDITFEEFKSVYSKIPWTARKLYPHLLKFQLSGIGEVFMNKDALKIMEFIKSNGGFITFADNFMLVTEKTAQKLVEFKVDEVFISLDGATKGVYENIRRGANFEKVIKNIKYLVDLKKKTGAKFLELTARFVPLKENIHELAEYVKLVKDIGLNKIEIPNLYVFEQNKDLGFDLNDFRKYLNQAVIAAKKANIEINVFEKKQHISECKRVGKSLYITCEGEILPCCALNQRNVRGAIKDYSFGNIYEKKIADIWDSEGYKKFRKAVLAGSLPKICEGCYWYDIEKGQPQRHPSTGSGQARDTKKV